MGRRAAGIQCLQLPLLLDMLQATPQKIDLQSLPTYLPLQFGDLAIVGPALAISREGLPSVVLQFPPPAMQHVRVDLAGSRHLGQ